MRSPIYATLQSTGLPCAYSHFKQGQVPPYIVYIGDGQNIMHADDTNYWVENTYQVEYYYKLKDEQKEADIEEALLDGGYLFEKSEDNYLSDQDVFVIYYYVS